MIDDTDKKILSLLKDNARITNADIAKQVEMAPSAVLERVRKLERRGIIKGYETRINEKSLGFGLKTMVWIKTNENVGSMVLGNRVAELREVQEVHCVAGEFSYLLKVCVRDVDDQAKFLFKLGEIEGVVESRTTLVMKTIKDSVSIDLELV